VLCGEAANTSFIFFGLGRPWLESMIYRTRGEDANNVVQELANTCFTHSLVEEKFEDIKGLMIICKSKGERQHNGK
jgi:hypothetical protein